MVAAEVTRRTVARACQEVRLVTSAATGPGDFSDTSLGRARLSSARRVVISIVSPRAEYIYAEVCRSREDFSNVFATKSQTGRLRREAFGVRRIPALRESSAPLETKAPEYGALQTLRAVWLRLCRPEDSRRVIESAEICLIVLSHWSHSRYV